MGYHCRMPVRITRREPATRGYAGRPSLANMRGFVIIDRRPGRVVGSSDAGSPPPQRGEPMPEEMGSDPFEDRHNGAASLGIP